MPPPPAGEAGLFLARWLRAPTRIGAVAPSGQALAAAMAAETLRHAGSAGTVVELGGGTGSITAALLAAGLPLGRLVTFERDPGMAGYLRCRFAGLHVIEGDAATLPALLGEAGVDSVSGVVSGLPLLSMPDSIVLRIVGGAFEAMSGEGRFVQFTYGPASPIARGVMRRLGIVGSRGSRIWRNLPPAVVWSYRRVEEPAAAASGD